MKESMFKRFAEDPPCTEKVLGSALLADSSLPWDKPRARITGSRDPQLDAYRNLVFFLNIRNIKFAVVTIF